MVHVMRETHPTTIGDEVTVGHSAVIHGCTIEDRVLVGMGAVLLNGVHVEHDSMIAAGTLLTEGTRIPPRSLVMGRPGKVKRAADRRRSRRDSLVHRQLRELPARLHDRTVSSRRLTCHEHRPARGMRDFLPEDVRRRQYVIGVIADVYQQLRLRAARDAGGREHRNAEGQVRRRGRPPDFQDPQARRGRRRPGRPTWRCATT